MHFLRLLWMLLLPFLTVDRHLLFMVLTPLFPILCQVVQMIFSILLEVRGFILAHRMLLYLWGSKSKTVTSCQQLGRINRGRLQYFFAPSDPRRAENQPRSHTTAVHSKHRLARRTPEAPLPIQVLP